MITLKDARDKAAILTKSKIPAVLSLHHWKNIGVISGVVDYSIDDKTGGKSGLYPDYVVIEIATAAELRKEITLKKIGEVRAAIIEKLKDQDKDLEDIASIGSGAGMDIISEKSLEEVGLINLDYQELLMFKLMDTYIRTFWKMRNKLFNQSKEVENNGDTIRSEKV